jgi:hypothetical protein
VEEAGISTMVIGSARDIMEAVKAPRAVFTNFPLGHQAGKPFDGELQLNILYGAFEALKSIEQPGTIVDLPFQWSEGNSWEKEMS